MRVASGLLLAGFVKLEERKKMDNSERFRDCNRRAVQSLF